MFAFLNAHGFDPGPTQRPLLAGALSGLAGTIPATATLVASGALAVEARILGLSHGGMIALGCAVMSATGGLYGFLFGRGANDRRGGWLFGMAFGFLLWAGGAVMVLPLLSGGQAPAGTAAIGIFVALTLWGTATGAFLPYIHGLIRAELPPPERPMGRRIGPNAASAGGDRKGAPPRPSKVPAESVSP